MKTKIWIVVTTLLVAGAVKVARSAEGKAHEMSARVPVLLELFTSEGCSSCPPADNLLRKLDRDQSLGGADVVVLSEHVDYWNEGGWVDPYSSPESSKRQRDYAARLESDVYTPQLVIDGTRQVVGSDRASVERAIQAAVRAAKIPAAVSATREGDNLQVRIEVGTIPGNKPAAVYLALAADQARSHVMRGENAGRELEHVAVVQSLVKIGEVTTGPGFRKDVRSALPRQSQAGSLRVVVFVQDEASRRVIAVGQGRV